MLTDVIKFLIKVSIVILNQNYISRVATSWLQDHDLQMLDSPFNHLIKHAWIEVKLSICNIELIVPT